MGWSHGRAMARRSDGPRRQPAASVARWWRGMVLPACCGVILARMVAHGGRCGWPAWQVEEGALWQVWRGDERDNAQAYALHINGLRGGWKGGFQGGLGRGGSNLRGTERKKEEDKLTLILPQRGGFALSQVCHTIQEGHENLRCPAWAGSWRLVRHAGSGVAPLPAAERWARRPAFCHPEPACTAWCCQRAAA